MPVGSLSLFDPNYLVSPSPPANNSQQSLQVTSSSPGSFCDASGNCTFLALLWGPNAMPVPGAASPLVDLDVTASQQGGGSSETTVTLVPPPLLLVHGIWSSAKEAGFARGSGGFYDWLAVSYPSRIFPVDYEAENAMAFDNLTIQKALLDSMGDALASEANSGTAARSVDVVAHSMGGLVTRYFLSTEGYLGNPALLSKPVHKLITIGTPHLGSQLAKTLVDNQDLTTYVAAAASPEVLVWCLAFSTCTLGDVMGAMGKPVYLGAQSLEPNSPQLQDLLPSNQFSAIVGQAPTSPISCTEFALDLLINAFLPLQTVGTILGQANDTIVPIGSQNPGSAGQTISGIEHTAICSWDEGETQSPSVWSQAFYWLTGGTGPSPDPSGTGDAATSALRPIKHRLAPPPSPVLNLIGYTQAAVSNVTISPATGSVLTIGSPANITAMSSTKTITEVLLLQTVADPTDTALMFATQSPFTIPYTPTRLGSANFGAITVFSDSTYAVTPLSYTLQPSGNPVALNLVNAPVASMAVGASRVVETDAVFSGGTVDVTQAATYTTGSGTSNVFQVGTGGTITAMGNGQDQLNVTYGGVTTSALVNVGSCTYSLSPTNQVVPSTGGPVAIQVTAPAGCAWMAMGGSTWLALTNASGTGTGSMGLTAAANTSGNAQTANVMLGNVLAVVTQAATACTYGVSQNQINVPAAGISGTITVTTSCPVVVSSNASWVSASGGASPVTYLVAPNNTGSQRTATLTIGIQAIPVVQTGSVIPGLPNFGLSPSAAAAGGPAFVLTVNGTNFVSGAAVQWNGTPLTTTFASASQLTAAVPASLIATVGTASVTVVNPGGATSATATFTTTLQLATPTAVFRNTVGSIELSTYASSTLSNSGGIFASDPSAAQDSSGNTFVTARDEYNSIWANVYGPGAAAWSGWQFGGGIIQGVPSLAVDDTGTGWIASRDTYNSYWLVSYAPGAGFGTWMPLLGIFSTDPLVAACGDGSIYLIGKDNWSSLWSGHYIPGTGSGTGFQGWQFGGGIITGKPSATCGSDNAVYVVAEDSWNSNWMVRVSGNIWGTWYFGGAITSVTPRIAALGNGSEAVVILDSTSVVYGTTYTEGTANGWQPWAEVGGILSDVAPAGVGGELYFAGKSPNGDLWWWRQEGNQWTWIGNNGVAAGALAAAPR